jgi:glycosyltransferase involved in cell wall biosynthesis
MTPHRPALSVGIPVYNGGRYIEGAVRSALEQDFDDLELIVADNASTDGTDERVRQLALEDKRIRFLPAVANQGAAWNWNRCVLEARAPVFNWLAADDLLAPSHSRRCLDALHEAGPDAVVAYPDAIIIDADGNETERYVDRLDLTKAAVPARVEELMTRLELIHPLLAVIRTDVLKRTRLLQGFAQADIVLLLELMLRGRAAKVDEPLFLRRRHAQNSMVANTTAELDEFYDTRSRDVVGFPTWRLVRAMSVAVGRADLSPADRALCYGLLGKTRYRKKLWRELRQAAPV